MKLQFIMPLRRSFALWSQKLNVLHALIVYFAISHADALPALIGTVVPPQYRELAAIPIAIVSFLIVSFVRLTIQPKLLDDLHQRFAAQEGGATNG